MLIWVEKTFIDDVIFQVDEGRGSLVFKEALKTAEDIVKLLQLNLNIFKAWRHLGTTQKGEGSV